MCFNKKSSAASTQTTQSTTIQRDERIATTDGSSAISIKDNGYTNLSVTNQDISSDIVVASLNALTDSNREAFAFSDGVADRALNALIEGGEDALNFAGDVFASAIGAVQDGNDRAADFVSSTQAQFAEARETDTKQLLEQVVKIVAIGTAGLVAYQVMK